MPIPERQLDLLLVEDNAGDVRLVKEALRECRVPLRLTVAQNGEEAIDVLYRRGPHESAPRPDLILLDLNLPRKSGHEVLKDIKQHEDLQTIPVVIVSSASSPAEIDKAYRLSANCYVQKPVSLDDTMQAIEDICRFWFQRVTLPM